MLASDRIEFLDQHLLGHVALVLGGRRVVARAGGRLELDFFADTFGHVVLLGGLWGRAWDEATSPRARRSASTASMPVLPMMRSALAETRRRTQRLERATQDRGD